MSLLTSSKKKDKRVLSGSCPDPRCQARLFFPAHGSASIECTECGQRHEQRQLLSVEEVTDPDVVLHNLLRNALLGVTGAPKKGTELVKVMGLSNYHCKLLSPVLTRYGMDKQTGKAKLLREMNQGEMFDCSLLGDRAFLIEPDHVSTVGYGRDRSGSLAYLHDTLEEVKKANGGGECLVPVHVDGDGHCLVHAVSRALVGRELFWHPLRENLKQNFKQNLDCYKALFQDFIDAAEWEDIINECDPLFVPPEGVPLGLRNIHIFGLANVLHRPIVLLDSLSGMQSPGDYSATFLPGLVPEERCRGKDGSLNKPICIAWSSSGRNHYIPLVGVRNAAPPTLPARLLPKAWGVPQELIRKYVKLEPDGGCVIGGDRGLQDKYLLRLVSAMEEVFAERHGIHPALVADVHQYVYRRTGVIGVQPEEVTEAAKKSVTENRLHRCLLCGALSELHVPPEWLVPGGKLYDLAKATHGQLRPDKNYSFPLSSVVCSYDPRSDALAPDYKGSALAACSWCHGTAVRRVLGSGAVVYLDGDRTDARSHGGKCGCGFKHFWGGEEYDNLPEAFPITLEWGGRVVRETVFWFQYEAAGSALNSNVYAVATKLVTKHFPGEFGSELLVQKVVNTILHHTAKKNPDEYNPVSVAGVHAQRLSDGAEASPDPRPPTKIILTGPKSKTLHKEELTMSRAERGVQQSIGERASVNQKRRTDELEQDQKARDQKARDQKAQDQKAQDQKAQDQKTQDQKAQDQKTQDQKAQDQKVQDQKVQDQKVQDQKAQDQKVRDQKAQDQKARDQKARDQKARDQKARDQKAQDQKVQDQKAQDQKAQDQKTRDQKARDQKARDQKARGRASSPGGSPETTTSSSAPATPTKSLASNQEKNIRVTTSDGRQAMLTLRLRTTFSELQSSISRQFGVPPARQCIRHGFPPRELPPPKAGEEDEPAALRHGDRVTVEILRAPEDGDPAAGLGASGSHAAAEADDVVASGRTSGRELQDSIDLEMSSLCLLATLMGETGTRSDSWSRGHVVAWSRGRVVAWSRGRVVAWSRGRGRVVVIAWSRGRVVVVAWS